jgi:carboxyl-terminal processing protease
MNQNTKKLACPILLSLLLAACGGGGGSATPPGSGNSDLVSTPTTPVSTTTTGTTTSLAGQCAVPRPAGTINPQTNQPYGDVQGSLTTEMAWIAAYVNETYLWYNEVPTVSSAPYVIGATVPYVNPTNNVQSTETLTTNYQVVDAYFNSQRTPLTTASGKPQDQFHFTYQTSVWQALSAAGNEAGFGFQVTLLSAAPPREAVIAYTSPNTPATQNNMARGAQIVSVNGVSVVNGTDIDTLNAGLFSPVAGTSYTFGVLDQGSSTPRTVTMTAANVSLTPVQNVGTLPAPNSAVGYMLFTDHIAPAEGELVTAVNQLKAANNGAGISDLVLDIRYNGGGLLAIASELAYMIAGNTATNGKIFEQEIYNAKNPFGFTTAQDSMPFFNETQGFSTTTGQALPQLGLSTVYVITTGSTCSASEAIINGLKGAGVKVVQIGGTTCGKPYGFYPQDNCSTTYFTIQFQGENNAGFGGYADGFIPGGTGATANNLPGCAVADDYTKQLGDPSEANLAAALQYRATGSCPTAASVALSKWRSHLSHVEAAIMKRSPARENRILGRATAH